MPPEPSAPPAPAPVPAPAPPAPIIPPVPAPPAPAPAPEGFPADTPVAEMTVAQQAAYWKHFSRQHEARAAQAAAALAAAQPKLAEFEALRAATQTDTEKAIAAARSEGDAAATKRLSSALVDAHLAAQIGARMPEAQRTALIQGVDRTAFMTADGMPDVAKVTAWVDLVAPAAPGAPGATGGQGGQFDAGQGQRPAQQGPSGLEAGRAEARRRFNLPAPPA